MPPERFETIWAGLAGKYCAEQASNCQSHGRYGRNGKDGVDDLLFDGENVDQLSDALNWIAFHRQ